MRITADIIVMRPSSARGDAEESDGHDHDPRFIIRVPPRRAVPGKVRMPFI